jgi:hypothetical protein
MQQASPDPGHQVPSFPPPPDPGTEGDRRACVPCGRPSPTGVIACPQCGFSWFTDRTGRLTWPMRLARKGYALLLSGVRRVLGWLRRGHEKHGLPMPDGLDEAALLAPVARSLQQTLAPDLAPVCPACDGSCGEEDTPACRARKLAAMRTESNPPVDVASLAEMYPEAPGLVEALCFSAPDDDARYVWRMETDAESGPWRALALGGRHLLWSTVLVYGGLALVELALPRTAFWLALAVLALAAIYQHPGFSDLGGIIARGLSNRDAGSDDPIAVLARQYQEWVMARSWDVFLVLMRSAVAPAAAFAVGSASFWFHAGFSGDAGSRWDWTLYVVQMMGNALTFDALEVVGVGGGIVPVTLAARASVVVLKATIAVCVAGIVFDVLRNTLAPREFTGTGREMWNHLLSLKVASVVRVQKLGKVSAYEPPHELRLDGDDGPRLRRRGVRL